MPQAQIGQIMGRSEGAIKALYRRTLLALRRDLEAHGFGACRRVQLKEEE
jgi:RNA polymerase sigma-70 factor (ECF subfamily)